MSELEGDPPLPLKSEARAMARTNARANRKIEVLNSFENTLPAHQAQQLRRHALRSHMALCRDRQPSCTSGGRHNDERHCVGGRHWLQTRPLSFSMTASTHVRNPDHLDAMARLIWGEVRCRHRQPIDEAFISRHASSGSGR